MARYLITYHAGEMPHGPESMAKARDAFMSWAEKTGAALVDPGAPVRESRTISSMAARSGTAENSVNGWSVIEATDADAAAQLLTDEPFINRRGIQRRHCDWDHR